MVRNKRGFLKTIILSVVLLAFQHLSAQYQSEDNNQGNWTDGSTWTGATPGTSNIDNDVEIYGYVTAPAIGFDEGDLYVYDTLVVEGNLTFTTPASPHDPAPDITIAAGGVLIVKGSFLTGDKVNVENGGYFVVTGSLIMNGTNSGFDNTGAGELFAYNAPTYNPAGDYSDIECPGPTPFPSSGCSYGNTTDCDNSGIGLFVQSLCSTQPNVSEIITDVSCYGNSDGAIDITVSGGVSPYSFDWSTTATSEDITGLTAGAYTVVVSGNDDCIAIHDYTVSSPPAIATSFTGLNSEYDINLDSPATLVGSPAGGVFTGPGITGNTFDPVVAGVGTHQIIYTYTDPTPCEGADTQMVTVMDYDNFAGARLISDIDNWCSSDAEFTTIGATADLNAASCWNTSPNYNRWFRFQATTNMVNVTVSRGGALGTIRRINVAIWENDGTTQIACDRYAADNDNVTVGSVNLTPGNWYYISVDNNYANYRGTFTMCVDDEVDYDFFEGAIELTDLTNWSSPDAAYSTAGATPDKIAAPCWNTSPDFNRWFRFQATSPAINIEVRRGGSYGTIRRINAALWEADGTTLVKCNRYIGNDDNVVVGAVGLTPGNWYYFSVDNNYAGYRGTFSLYVDDQVDYDYYEGAYLISDIDNWCSADAEFTTAGATPDQNAGSCWNTSPNYNRWFRFTATGNMINVTVKRGGSYGTVRRINAAIWEADGTTQVECNRYVSNDDNVVVGSTNLIPGNDYYISVDNNYSGYRGTFSLCVDSELDYDYAEGARDITSIINSCSSDAEFTTIGATPDRSAPACWNTSPSYNRWFKFLATKPAINIQVKRGGSFGTIRRVNLALFDTDTSTVLACNRYVNNDDQVEISYEGLTVGQWYFVSVDNNYSGYRGTFTLCMDDETSYDYYEGAKELGIIHKWSSEDAAYSTIGATPDKNAASCWNTSPNYNRWFKFVATTSEISVEIRRGGSYGTVRRINAALWQADGITEVSCKRYVYNDDIVELEATSLTPGNTYYVSIDNNYSGYRGTFSLYVNDAVGYDYQSGAIDVTQYINSTTPQAAYSTVGATPDGAAGSCWNTAPNYNRWFKFQATTPGINARVLRGGSDGTIRRVNLALWDTDGTTELSCKRYVNNDDIVEIDYEGLTPGNWYYLSVDNSYSGYRGTFTLELNDDVSYDFYEGAIELVDVHNWQSTDAEYTTIGASADKNAASCWNTTPNYNRWFKFTATTPVINVEVKRGGSFGTIRRINTALWEADGTTEVVCNRYVNNDDNVSINANGLTPGNDYYISVDNNYSGYRGTFTLYVNDEVDYDYYEGAYELTDLNNWQSADAQFTTIGATADMNAASCWNTAPNYNRWFKFQAVSSDVQVQVLRGGAQGSIRRINLALWESDGTTELACNRYAGNDDNVSITHTGLVPGNWYYISVDNNYSGYRGTFTLQVNNVSSNEYYAIADGAWNNPNTWSLSEGGPPAGSTPGVANVVHIKGFDITVSAAAVCAELDMQVENDNTSLTISSGSLAVGGKVVMVNNGFNFNGAISLQNAGALTIGNDLTLTRAGGDNTFGIQLANTASLNIAGQLNVLSSAGGVTQTTVTINDNATLQTGDDINLTHTGGQKILVQQNNSGIINAGEDIVYNATGQDQIEVELNTTSTLNISGSFTRASSYGILDCNDNSTLILLSADNQQIFPQNAGAGTDDFTFQNVTVNNSKIAIPQVILEGAVSIPGVFTLTDGVIQTTASNLLTLENTATLVGGSASSYIDGPFEKVGNTSFTFPIGDGSVYRPLTISAPSNITDAFSAQYINEDPDPTYSTSALDGVLDHVADCEYWVVDRTAGSSNVTATIGWDGSTCCINDIAILKVAGWDGVKWATLGNGGTTGDITNGTITTAINLTTASNPITLGDPNPIVSFSGLAASYCESATPVVLTGSPTDANGVFTGDGITDNGDGTASFDPGAAGDGTFTITYTYTNGVTGCTKFSQQSVVVDPSPVSNVTGSATVCEGIPVDVSMFFTGTPPWDVTYTNDIDTWNISTNDNPYVFSTADTGMYHVTALVDAKGCVGSSFGNSAHIQNYSVPVKPIISVVTGDTTFCDGGSVTLESSAGDYYYWSNFETAQQNIITESMAVTVQVFDTYGCLSEISDPITITENDRPIPTISGSASACHNDTVTYSTEAGMNNYTWVVSAGGSVVTGGAVNDDFVEVAWDAIGSQSVSVNYENADTCSAASPTIRSITVIGYPTQAAQPTSNDTLLCVNSSNTSYTSTGATGAISYEWIITPGGAGSVSGTGTTGTVDWNDTWTGSAYIQVRGVSSCGTGTWSDSIVVVVSTPPLASLTGIDTLYFTSSPNDTAIGIPTNANGAFETFAGFSDYGDGTALFRPSVTGAGTFDLIYVYTDGGCTVRDTVSTQVKNLPYVSFASATGSDDEDAGTIQITIELSSVNSTDDVDIDYSVTGGTATGAGTDYTFTNGAATIPSGDLSVTIPIILDDDIMDEPDETVVIELSNPVNSLIGNDTTHTFTIIDDDPPPTVSFDVATMSGVESVSPVQFIVNLSAPSAFDVSFDYATADGTATNGVGNDYTAYSGTWTIPAGKTADTIIVTVLEDAVEETNEDYTFTLSNFVNSSAGAITTSTYTILDNDGLGWVGPAGVGNLSDQVNVWYASYYSDNLADGDKVSTSPNQWDDLSENDIDAFQNNASYQPTFYDVSPTWNGRPLLRFNSALNEYLEINDNPWMNSASGAQSKRTIIMAYRTGSDIATRQVLFEEGGTARGLNIYIEDDTLYIGGWNKNNDDGGATTPWQYTSVKAELTTNTPYFAIMQFDFDDGTGTGEVRGSLNGVSLGALPGAGKLFRHRGDIGIGAMHDGACFEDLTCPGGVNYHFDGYISEFISGNIVYNDAAIKLVHNYLAAQYGIALPPTEDIYDYETAHGYELIGVGQVDNDNYHNFAQGQGIIRLQNPSNMGDGKFILTGHDDGDITAWVNTEVPNGDANIVRVAREWRVDKQGGDIGTIDLIIDSTRFGSYFSSYSAMVMLIDDDGDFTSGTRTVELQSLGGGLYEAAGIDFTKGEYFSIARIRPAIEFQLASSEEMEDVGTVDIAIRMNYASTTDVTVNYLSANGTADDAQVPIADYDALSGTFTLPAGDTSGMLNLTINNDAVIEADEDLTITLSNPSSGTNLGTNSVHTFTIQDDDNTRKVQFVADSIAGTEDSSPTITLHLTENNPINPVTVDYNVLVAGTASDGGVDYSIISSTGTITFGVGDTLENIPAITINDDAFDEDDETIIIELTNPTNANLGDTTIIVYTIQDNDATPQVSFEVATASGAESYSPIQIDINLSAISGKDVQIDHTITGGSAIPGGVDFLLSDATITIPAGEDSVVVLLDIFNDIVEENNEDIEITLSNPVNATMGAISVFTHTIIDDDGMGWDGPGGVGNFDNQIACWLRSTGATNLSDGIKVGIDPVDWNDMSGNGNDAYQTNAARQPKFWDASPTWNGRPVIEFDATAGRFLEIADNADMNIPSGAQTKRTLVVAFRPATDVTSRQVVYEEGGGVRGLNFYIEGGNFYIGGWNDNNDDAGATTPWSYTTVSSAISANTPYFAILQFDFDDLAGTGEVRGSLNGVDLGALPGAGKLFRHPGDIGIGGQSNGACYVGDCDGGDRNFFGGHIAEFMSGNTVFNDAQMKIVHNYLASKYNITLPGGDDIYDYESTHGYQLIGIGQENASHTHYISQGPGIIRIENPTDAGNGRYLTIGHNNGTANDWKEWDEIDVPNSDENIQRLERVWRVDKQGGDIGAIKVRLDTIEVPVKSFGYSKYVLIIDSDGDFTSGARVIELVHDAGEYCSVDNIDFTKGEYFTIGIVKPSIQFTLAASNDQEPVSSIDPAYPQFSVELNYQTATDVTVDYATSDGTAVAPGDYTAETGSLTISAGDTATTLNITVVNDTDIEPDETVLLSLSNPSSGINLGTNSVHTYTINDDDNPRKVQFTSASSSGDESISSVVIEVSINMVDAVNYTTFDYSITGGTATNGVGN
ncbi:MAG: hypothetical protein MI922_06890, partial [Bacteroidales bacterium]|nr:hypothetical protein [Bacteroidales bacterium]